MNNHNFDHSDTIDDEMLPEYDFTGGLRGQHHEAYRRGHTVTIHQTDGQDRVQYLTIGEASKMVDTDVMRYYPDAEAENNALRNNLTRADGAIMLDPDVREYFPDAETVNNALRTLISLFPKNRQVI